jgi:hypothetical protein
VSDLVSFYAARLDEDEAAAKAQEFRGTVVLYSDGEPTRAEAEYFATMNPARVLREVEAGRAILAAYKEALHIQAGYKEVAAEEASREVLEMVCRHLAAIYSGHPDYRQEWKP